MWLIIDPEDDLIEIGLWHRDFFQLCGLDLALSVATVEHEVGKRQDQYLFLIGKL